MNSGYITKGDNNPVSDEGYLTIDDNRTIEPVEKNWVVGKALFTIPLVGLLPLHIFWVIVVVIIAIIIWDWYAKTKEEGPGKKTKKAKTSQKTAKSKK